MEHVKHEPLQPKPVQAPSIWIISDATLCACMGGGGSGGGQHEPLQPEPVEAPGIWIISDAALHQRSTVREVLCA